jgi:hypothetical protein
VSWHPTSPDDGVVRHWSRRPLDGDRHAVSVAVAWKQFELCQRLGRADVRLLEPDSL